MSPLNQSKSMSQVHEVAETDREILRGEFEMDLYIENIVKISTLNEH